jgi:hypothetical protein
MGRRLPTVANLHQKILAPLTYQVVGHERADVRQHAHVGELQDGPFPSAGFPPHNGHRGHALQGEREEH